MQEYYHVKFNMSKNHWQTDIVEFTFRKEYIDKIFSELYISCKDKFHYTSAYQYDEDAMKVLKNNISEIDTYRPIIQLLIEMCQTNINKENYNNWYDTYVSMRRTLEVFNAYAYPQFLDAKHNQSYLGN